MVEENLHHFARQAIAAIGELAVGGGFEIAIENTVEQQQGGEIAGAAIA